MKLLSWAAFGELRSISKSNVNNSSILKVFDSCVLAVLNGAETFTLIKASANKRRVAQRAMERSESNGDRKRKKWIRQQTRVTDVMKLTVNQLQQLWIGAHPQKDL